MKIVAIIPARYQSSRFPGKPLSLINNLPMICHVYNNIKQSNLFSEVIVATDDQRIKSIVEKYEGKALMTSQKHQSGSDRIAEVIENMDCDVIINVQGDEPLLDGEILAPFVELFSNKSVEIASMMHKMENSEINNPNYVKVVVDNNNNALYFSRAPIPFNRDKIEDVAYYRHIGIYGYTKSALLDFVKLPLGSLENIEKLEQLRFLENNYSIKMLETNYSGFGVDTPEDLEKAIEYINMK